MKYKLLRFSLLSIFAMLGGLWGNSAWAADKWVKTDASELKTGDVVVIVDQTTATALPNDKGTSSAPNAEAVTLSGDMSTILDDVDDNLQWEVTVSDAGYQFCVAGTDNFLYCTNTNNGVRVGTNENNVFEWVADAANINSTEPYLVNVATGRYIGVFNSQDWRCYTSINTNIKETVTAFYKLVKDDSDTREATTITLGDHQTKGEVGNSVNLPSATVTNTSGTPLDVSVTWESTNTDVASIDVNDNVIHCLAAGTTTIKALFAGDNSNQPSTASFQLTVENAKVAINSFQELQAQCTSDNTPATITFHGEQVIFINGSNVFLADANGYGALIYQSSHGLEVGQTLTGTIDAVIKLYQGNAEIINFSKDNLTIGTADVVPVEKTVGEITPASQSTLVTLKNVTYSQETEMFTDAKGSSIKFYDKFKVKPYIEEDMAYDVTGVVVMYNDLIEICPRTAEDIVEAAIVEPAGFQNFAVIVNNQQGTLLTDEELVQGTAVSFGVAVDGEGNTYRVAVDDAKSIATVSGNYHSEHGMTNLKVVTTVPGPVKILVGQCTYSSKQIKVTDSEGNVVATATPTTVCWKNDRSNVTELIYEGEATTLTITGPDYCPFVAVKEYVAPAEFQDFAAIVNNQQGTLLTEEEMATQHTPVMFGVAVDAEGNTIRVDADDASSIATISGKFHSDHGLTALKVVTAVPGPVKILVGQCTYSSKDIKVTNSDGNVVATATPATVCWKNDRSNVTELIYEGEATTLTITGPDYCPFVAVQKIEIEPKPSFPIVATWDFTNADVVAAAVALSGSTEAGTIKAVEDNGLLLTVEANGQTIRNNGNSIQTGNGVVFKVPVQGKKDVVTVTGYSAPYFAYSVAGVDATEAVTVYTATAADVKQGYVEIVNKGQYLIAISVTQNEDDSQQDITATWDYADADVMAATIALSGSSAAGEVEAAEKNGVKMIVEANGASFRNNGNNIQVRSGAVFKVPVRNAGDLVTVKGYPGYSHYTIGNSTTELTETNTYIAKRSDAEAGYVAVTSVNDNNYYLSLSVVQYAPKEMITLDNEPATINFPFNLGTEGQTATFSNADYFLNSKVTHGSNWNIQDSQTYAGTTQTRLTPVAQHNENLTDDDAVSFLFTPKPGFTFTPTKVSFTANRFGTDNGLIDVYWQNADETTVELEKGVKPERNNSGVNTVKNYDIEGATPGEGICGLKLFLYHLQAGKQIGLADIVIEGTLSGTEKEMPILASFKINGNEYAAEDVFGDLFEATLELKNGETMVSAENPLTEVTAANGEVGELTYEGTETQCKVTIPLTASDTQADYVLNVVYKPYFTLQYLDVEGNVLTTQQVEKDAAISEFAYDIAEVPATKDGYKARGWFKTGVIGEKYTTDDVITGNISLYAIQTEIEEASTHKKYFFDLADKFFYAEDHEAFNPAGDGFYWHDAQHGWAFKNGNTVDLLVGPKATITVTLCQYGSGTGIAVKKDGETLATIDGIAEGDGGTAVYNYEGEAGTLTLEMQCGGEMYIHAMKIVNTAEVNFDSEGNWYFVKAGDAGSLIDVLDVVNGVNASRDAARSFIFLPDGIYDLDATVKTAITGHNISLIGQSMDNTIIVTTPDKSIEGLGKADLLDVSGTNLYMQDLTLKNALDYYSAGSAGRAAVLQDAGNRTIGKNVRMLSYQDTYYSSNSSQQAYWETCDIHGTVDFICGGGDIRFQNTTISLEPRALNGTGSRTIVAPTTTTQFGYVFDGCTVVDLANGNGEWNFGRTWQNEPITVYLNTTLDDNAKNTLISTRWIEKGMNNKDPKFFGEYGTKDAAGNDITPTSNNINSFGGTFETILTADQAAGFAYDKMFTDWDPMTLATQVQAPSDAKLMNGKVTWSPTYNNASAYALFKNGEFVGLTEGFSLDVEAGENDVLTLRAANPCGGLGEPVTVIVITGIDELATDAVPADGSIYNMQGVRVQKAQKGLYIINGRKVVMK